MSHTRVTIVYTFIDHLFNVQVFLQDSHPPVVKSILFFFPSRPFSSLIIHPLVVAVLCQCAHKDIHFKTILWINSDCATPPQCNDWLSFHFNIIFLHITLPIQSALSDETTNSNHLVSSTSVSMKWPATSRHLSNVTLLPWWALCPRISEQWMCSLFPSVTDEWPF